MSRKSSVALRSPSSRAERTRVTATTRRQLPPPPPPTSNTGISLEGPPTLRSALDMPRSILLPPSSLIQPRNDKSTSLPLRDLLLRLFLTTSGNVSSQRGRGHPRRFGFGVEESGLREIERRRGRLRAGGRRKVRVRCTSVSLLFDFCLLLLSSSLSLSFWFVRHLVRSP